MIDFPESDGLVRAGNAVHIDGAWVPDKAGARARVAAWADRATKALIADTPEVERLSWPAKEAAARAHQAGAASAEDLAMLEAEAIQTGETVDALAARILTNAAAYKALIGQITGLRRKTLAAIDAAQTVDELDTLLATAQAEAEALLAQAQSPSATATP